MGRLSHDRRTKIKTRFKNGKKIRVIRKLDEEQVRWIIRQNVNGQMSSAEIAESMGVYRRWVRNLWSRYRFTRPEDSPWPHRWADRPRDCQAAGSTPRYCPVATKVDAWQ